VNSARGFRGNVFICLREGRIETVNPAERGRGFRGIVLVVCGKDESKSRTVSTPAISNMKTNPRADWKPKRQ
jgi:hypothetical protein